MEVDELVPSQVLFFRLHADQKMELAWSKDQAFQE